MPRKWHPVGEGGAFPYRIEEFHILTRAKRVLLPGNSHFHRSPHFCLAYAAGEPYLDNRHGHQNRRKTHRKQSHYRAK